ncbi:glycinin-like [Arachis ipaensis]|uniref:glycinin-like n=1 Tax=Arachis ipaensis TaxID=130454 RepID=UPI0007AF0BD5|nr:glycinin-like [Arachis ipaensis]
MVIGPFRLSLYVWLVFLTSACFGTRLEESFNECQLDRLNALTPDNRIESQGGITETWNSNHPELRCAGVTLLKRTIFPNGFHLPSYANYPQLIFIAQGNGVVGISLPGCPVTYEEAESQSREDRRRRIAIKRESEREQEQQGDSHHKIYHLRQGHLLAIPAGVPYWSFNYGNEPIVAITLLDTSNLDNQLDPSPRRFYLAGNPEEEHPETQQQQPQTRRRHGQHQQEEEEGNNVLSGFSTQLLAHAFGVDEEIARILQNPPEQTKDQIVRVEGGFRDVISPRWGEGKQYEDELEERQRQPRRRDEQGKGYDYDDDRRPHRQDPYRQGDEDDRRPRGSRQRQGRIYDDDDRRPDDDDRQGYDDDDRRPRWSSRPKGQGRRYDEDGRNGVEETLCSPTLVEDIARPSRADFYNPAAGRISSVNSLTFPILRWFQLSAEHVLLYRNGIYSPHWNNNANSIIYGLRGEGRIQVVNSQGNAVFNGVLREGQILLVPQNFAVGKQAGNEGFEYVAFKTTDRASISHLKQVFRGIPADVLINAFGLRNHQVSALKYNGNQTPLVAAYDSQYGPQRRHQT